VRHYRLTAHALGRLAKRHIPEERVRQVINSPDEWSPDYSQDSYCLVKRYGRAMLKVWVLPPWPPEDLNREIVVKSVAWKD